MGDDAAIDAFDIPPFTNHPIPPGSFQVVLEFDAERAIVPASTDAAVDFARLKHESTLGTQRNHLFDGGTAIFRRLCRSL
jgi:hypothetical protein